MSSLDLDSARNGPKIRRLNRLPIIVLLVLVLVFIGVVIWGLSQRGIGSRDGVLDGAPGQPASDLAQELTRGITPGIIDESGASQPSSAPSEIGDEGQPVTGNPFQPRPTEPQVQQGPLSALESEAEWHDRLQREFDEARLRELHRQELAQIQASPTAANSPLPIDLGNLASAQDDHTVVASQQQGMTGNSAVDMNDIYAAAMRAGTGPSDARADPNIQGEKRTFFNQEINEVGYVSGQVIEPMSAYELKRGSVIPATLVTGINSDLPGRITARVRQNVYDSASGHYLLIPQGASLVGRYDSNVSFGQSRVLVIWTDLVFPDGSTLQLGGLPGMDVEGYSGFTDQVDNRLLETFGSAVLVALIGTGIDSAFPPSSSSPVQNETGLEDAARRNFADTFGSVAGQTISQNLDVQPALQIRPGYQFNVFVEQDIIFSRVFASTATNALRD